MKLVITDYIRRSELKPLSRFFTVEDIKKSLQKINSSGIEMSNFGYRECKLVKVRLSGKTAGRMIIFIQLKEDYYFPVILRLKKDKVFGQNLLLENKKAEERIVYNLQRIFDDVEAGRYEKIEL